MFVLTKIEPKQFTTGTFQKFRKLNSTASYTQSRGHSQSGPVMRFHLVASDNLLYLYKYKK